MKAIFIIIAALALCACGSVQKQWDSAQAVYNATLTQLVDLRAPCVPAADHPEYGPQNPRCLIDDATYAKIEPVRKTVDQCLSDADQQLRANNEDAAKTYIACAQGSLGAFTAYIIEEN